MGEEISNAEILAGLNGTKTGYTIKTVSISNAGGTGARVSGSGTAAKIGSYTGAGNLTLSLVFEHATKADKTITGAQFEITSGVVSVPLSWSRQNKVYSPAGEISNAELLGGVRGTKTGYRIKSVQITSDSSSSGATVSGSGAGAKIVGYRKATILTLTLVLEHGTKPQKTLSNAMFEIRKMPVPADLTWRKQSKVYSVGGEISNAELLNGLSGTKIGYRVKTLTISDVRGTSARVSGTGTSAKIVGYTKVGILTLSIVFEHDTKEDKNITGGAFEITKGSAPSLSWTKQKKIYTNGREITNADLLAGVTGSGKTGYTIKTVRITNTNGTGARVSGSGRAAKIISYNKVGTLTLTLVLEHPSKEDATISNAQFEIYKIFDITGSGVLALKTGVDKNSLTTVIIPNTIDGTTVTSIGSEAFRGCTSLTRITIPNSVTSIGNWTFSTCRSLTNITIPNSVTSIGNATFHNCISLTSITIPNSVTSIGDWAFNDCRSLTSITIPNSVKSIGSDAFSGCRLLTSITIPNSVTSIGDWAFYNCRSLTRITIPNSVTSIGDQPFKDCSKLTTIHVPNAKVSGWEANLKKGNGASVVGY